MTVAQGTIGRDGYVVVPGARVAVAAWNDWIATSMLGFPYLPIIPNPWHQWNAPGEEPDFWLDAASRPNPTVSFTVKLDGLTNNGLPVVVPTIRFEFGRIWSQTRMNAR
jgi:hypothetical protein